MRSAIRVVILVSLVLGVAAFIYVIGFMPLDPARSPRAAALRAGPNVPRAITSIRLKMAQRQFESAAGQAVELVEQAPESAQARLYALLALHLAGRVEEAQVYGADLVELTDSQIREGETLGTTELYLRGWGLRILGVDEEARPIFLELAERIESLPAGHPARNGYNLACYWSLAGETEAALAWWSRNVRSGRFVEPGYWRVDPDLEPLHDDARFWALAQEFVVEPEDVLQWVPVPDDEGDGDAGDGGDGGDGGLGPLQDAPAGGP